MDLVLFVLRMVVGLTFAAHGAQKLYGWFGGNGIEATGRFFESIGLRPGALHARVAGMTEFFGGLMIAAGFFTTIAAAALIAVMTAAVLTVHLKKGFWAGDGGYEFNLILGATLLALAGTGAAAWSADNALGIDLSGTGWAIAALAAGLAGGVGAVLVGRAYPERRRERDRRGRHPMPTPG